MMGFQTYVARDVKVNVGGEHSLNVTLDVGELTSIVTVAAGVDLVNTSDASVSTTVQTRQIQDLPLNARNPVNLVALQRGPPSAATHRHRFKASGRLTPT